MLWLKAFHLIFMVTWFVGLFYLPRLFVYHTQVKDSDNHARFVTMERKLFIIMTMGAVLTYLFGLALIHQYGSEWFRSQHWLHAKFLLILLLTAFHVWCYFLMRQFALKQNSHSERFYRLINEIPAIPLVGIILLAVLRPF